MDTTNRLEQAVLQMLLSGDAPALEVLRTQAASAKLAKRELSGVGFFCTFDIPSDAPRFGSEINFEIDDVHATIEGLKHGAGFVLFIRKGCMETLEGFSYDEPWPEDFEEFSLRYQQQPRHLPLPTNV